MHWGHLGRSFRAHPSDEQGERGVSGHRASDLDRSTGGADWEEPVIATVPPSPVLTVAAET